MQDWTCERISKSLFSILIADFYIEIIRSQQIGSFTIYSLIQISNVFLFSVKYSNAPYLLF